MLQEPAAQCSGVKMRNWFALNYLPTLKVGVEYSFPLLTVPCNIVSSLHIRCRSCHGFRLIHTWLCVSFNTSISGVLRDRVGILCVCRSASEGQPRPDSRHARGTCTACRSVGTLGIARRRHVSYIRLQSSSFVLLACHTKTATNCIDVSTHTRWMYMLGVAEHITRLDVHV